ncbi:glycine zipper 2TM domain-containing protein [Novosphingobium guangzhouense]|uniref:17 kDa surface antigen n=1 Tax=Novosphingobium guangzhouense TaxID=1850347 RepID=A0A2K2FSH1_9SPHN|nr:glycine zipper 2TM domain-containing protein [Novosphingobium guangzhouense]PNU01743.1 hypothetical protein A8V01_11820 [Novosphingobium guangzhouense]
MRLPLHSVVLATLSFTASPALAHDWPEPPAYGYNHDSGYDPREAWLADCRQRLSSRDSGVGGAVIGGVVGGLAGNRIAGRGNRTVGTVAGAAVGAVAGAAIDKAEDRGRNRDECEAYLDDYYARYQTGGGYPGYGPGYGQGYGSSYASGYGAPQGYYPAYGYPQQGCCMTQPMMIVPVAQPKPNCTETIEYVYEDVPVRPARRAIPRRTKVVPDKRVKIVPDKRVPIR